MRLLLVIFITVIISCSFYIYDCRRYTENESKPCFCEIHKRKLDSKIVRIDFGLYRPIEYLFTPNDYKKKVIYDSLYAEMKIKTRYAIIGNHVLGGCVQMTQKYANVYYCKKCNEDRLKWINGHSSLSMEALV